MIEDQYAWLKERVRRRLSAVKLAPKVCRHRHKPPYPNDGICTAKYLDEQFGRTPPALAVGGRA